MRLMKNLLFQTHQKEDEFVRNFKKQSRQKEKG